MRKVTPCVVSASAPIGVEGVVMCVPQPFSIALRTPLRLHRLHQALLEGSDFRLGVERLALRCCIAVALLPCLDRHCLPTPHTRRRGVLGTFTESLALGLQSTCSLVASERGQREPSRAFRAGKWRHSSKEQIKKILPHMTLLTKLWDKSQVHRCCD